MPDALKLLTTRRSFKAVELAGPGPSAAEIDALLTIASRVPDHGKLTLSTSASRRVRPRIGRGRRSTRSPPALALNRGPEGVVRSGHAS